MIYENMKFLGATILLFLSLWTTSLHAKVSLETLEDDINQFLTHGKESQDFIDTLDAIRLKNPIKGNNPKIEMKLLDGVSKEEKVELTCILCSNIADTVLGWIGRGDTKEELIDQTTALCVTAGITTENVCRGVVNIYIDMFMWLYTYKNETGDPVTSGEFCGLALYPDCPLRDPEYEWSVNLDFMGPKPAPIEPQLPPVGSPTMQVLQLTDLHVDPNYLPGGNAECGEPTCCRFDQGAPVNESGEAGYWGDYRDCDLPVHTFTSLVQQAKTSHPDVAYVMFTGDVIDHGIWATTNEGNRDLFNLVYGEIRGNFPDVPILPIFGNHDAHPLNAYTSGDWDIPANVSSEWAYQLAVNIWGEWLPGITDTVMRGGYYTYLVNPDLLVIALNNNICYTNNFWLIYDSFDPAGQLVWLAETLLAAEQAGQKVHILSHLAADSGSCFAPWRTDYRRIIDRFENIISAQFFGHTHDDVFNIYYALEDTSRPNNVAFSGGSGTPYSDANPNYKVYTIEAEYPESAYQVLDVESWYFNLTEANLAGPDVAPDWQKLYTFTDAYEVPSLLARDLDNLVYRMAQFTSLQQQYFGFAVKMGDSSVDSGCMEDAACLKDYVCEIVENTAEKCNELPWPEVK